jgi:hypothetical protein
VARDAAREHIARAGSELATPVEDQQKAGRRSRTQQEAE